MVLCMKNHLPTLGHTECLKMGYDMALSLSHKLRAL